MMFSVSTLAGLLLAVFLLDPDKSGSYMMCSLVMSSSFTAYFLDSIDHHFFVILLSRVSNNVLHLVSYDIFLHIFLSLYPLVLLDGMYHGYYIFIIVHANAVHLISDCHIP